MAEKFAVLSFLRLDRNNKLESIRNVVARMTNNEDFPNPDIPLSEISDTCNLLEATMFRASSGDRLLRLECNNYEKLLDDKIRKLVIYVNRTANGNELKLLSTGFEINKDKYQPSKPLLSIELGQVSGTVKLKRKRDMAAYSYTWQMCAKDLPVEENEWVVAGQSGQSTFVIKGLTPLMIYSFRVAVLNHEGLQPYCTPISAGVL
jgi:hypothetical protein